MRKALLFLVLGGALGLAPACSKDDGSAAASGATAPAGVAVPEVAPVRAAAGRRCLWNSPWSSARRSLNRS